MRASYYVIELSKRWLTVLLVALALVMVLAFALGYGAAWSVLSGSREVPSSSEAAATLTPTPIEEVVIPTEVPEATPPPTATSPPEPTATPRPPEPTPTPTPVPAPDEFHVQVLVSTTQASVDEARRQLERLGFPRDHHKVITVQEPGNPVLYKLRVGPFPDRGSADRVVQRMSAAGFPDAWVVVP